MSLKPQDQNTGDKTDPLDPGKIVGWIDKIWKKIKDWAVATLLALVISNGVFLESRIRAADPKMNWVFVTAAILEGLLIGLALAVPVLVFVKRQVVKNANEAIMNAQKQIPIAKPHTGFWPTADTHFTYVEVEEEYGTDHCIQRRQTTLHITNIGQEDIWENIVSLAKYDSQAVRRKLYIEQAPDGVTEPYIILRKVAGDGHFEQKIDSGHKPEAWWYTNAFKFTDALKPDHHKNSMAFTYEYTYYNLKPPKEPHESLIFAPGANIEALTLRVKFHDASPPVYPRSWAPAGTGGESSKYTAKIPKYEENSGCSVVTFHWPETAKGFPGNTSYLYGLDWSWDNESAGDGSSN